MHDLVVSWLGNVTKTIDQSIVNVTKTIDQSTVIMCDYGPVYSPWAGRSHFYKESCDPVLANNSLAIIAEV